MIIDYDIDADHTEQRFRAKWRHLNANSNGKQRMDIGVGCATKPSEQKYSDV